MSLVDKFLDVPFKPAGRDLAGLDCWGLVYLYYKDLGKDIPSYADYAIGVNTAATTRIMRDETERMWRKVDAPQEGDVVLCRYNGLPVHVGIYINKQKMLHIEQGCNVVCESIKGLKWKHRILGYYRLKD